MAGRPGRLAGLAPGLRLGTLVTPVTFGAPGILAKTVVTLDVLTGGRAYGCNLPASMDVLDHKLAALREHCLEAGRNPAEVQVTVLDIPVIGRDRDHAAAIVEKLRGRTPATAFR